MSLQLVIGNKNYSSWSMRPWVLLTQAGIPFEEVMAERAKLNPAGRFGDPEEFGQACAFLCGAKAGFITGQNILLDGGAFPGTL